MKLPCEARRCLMILDIDDDESAQLDDADDEVPAAAAAASSSAKAAPAGGGGKAHPLPAAPWARNVSFSRGTAGFVTPQ